MKRQRERRIDNRVRDVGTVCQQVVVSIVHSRRRRTGVDLVDLTKGTEVSVREMLTKADNACLLYDYMLSTCAFYAVKQVQSQFQ